MGYNALPTLPVADAKVEDDVRIELQVATQVSDLAPARDAALTPYVKLVLPFRGVAAFEVDAVPVELWRVSPETQARLGTPDGSGVAPGDVRVGARFTLLDEGALNPAVGFRFVVKTTSGKSFADRRFTDAPGYVFDGLFAKTLPWGVGPFVAVRALAKLGVTVWQQGSHWQDDALDAGAALQLRARGGSRLELEWRAYWGYEQYDRPAVLGLTYLHRASRAVGLLATVNCGLTSDAPPWELRVGIVLHFDARSIPVVGPALAGPEPPAPAQGEVSRPDQPRS